MTSTPATGEFYKISSIYKNKELTNVSDNDISSTQETSTKNPHNRLFKYTEL